MGRVIVKERLWPRLGYEPHPRQVVIHRSTARHRVNAAGRRFGKSHIGGHDLVPEAYVAYLRRQHLEATGKRDEWWIVGPNYTDAEKEFRVFYNDCKRLKMPFDKPGTYYDSRSGNMQVSLFEGKFLLQAKSAAHPESLVGEGLRGVIMAEAAKMKESVWTKYIRPTLADFGGKSLFNSSPEGKNWFYDLWMLGQNADYPDWESWRNPSWENPFVFPRGATLSGVHTARELLEKGGVSPARISDISRVDEEIIGMMMEMSEELFKQEVAADFTEFVGRVFKRFDEETHVRNISYNPALPLFGAVDYGWTNPFVWLDIQVDEWGRVYVLDELYQTEKDTSEIAQWLLEHGRGNAARFYPDPAEPDDTHTLSRILKVPAMGNTGGPLKNRLEMIRQHLKSAPAHLPEGHPEKKPMLIISPRCKELIREMNDYRYPDSPKDANKVAKEEPMDKDNHGPEALGRFFKGYFNAPVKNGTRVRKGRVRRAA